MVMPGPQVNTPPPAADEGIVPFQLGSPKSTSSPRRRRAPVPKAKLNPSPRERRARARRQDSDGGLKGQVINGPLSELTKHMHNVPLRDMEAWVRRPYVERMREVNEKGKVSRPMNSFMLYRSAYAERTKSLLSHTNHQRVSCAAGQSWRMEPQHIRDKYEILAKIERDTHAVAHPDYKFTPNKGPAISRKKVSTDEGTPSGSVADAGSPTDWEDSEYASGSTPVPSFLHNRSQSFDVDRMYGSRSSTPFDGPDPVFAPGNYLSSSWHASYPSHSVHPAALHGVGPHIEDVHFRRPSPLQQDLQYGSSSSTLAALPGGTHHELLEHQPTDPLPGRVTEGGHMDPQLLSYESDPAGPPVGPAAFPNGLPTHPVWADESAGPCYLTTSAPLVTSSPAPYHHPHMGSAYLPSMQTADARDPSWDLQQHHQNHELEPWLEPHTSSY